MCGSHVQWSVTDNVLNIDVCSIENEKISMVCMAILARLGQGLKLWLVVSSGLVAPNIVLVANAVGSAPGHHQRQCESHQRESPMLRSLPNLKSVLLLQLQILLSYRASPNYRDAKGLTPLYHTAIMGDGPATCRTLLGIKDAGGWTELHQV